MRDHLEIVHRQTGIIPEQLKSGELPEIGFYLWNWFCDISGGRQYGEFGAMAITYQEIQAWSQLTKMEPMAWEVEALKLLDRAFLTEGMKK